ELVVEHGVGSPIERHITWDDAEAGPKYRLNEARQILRSINVVIQNGDKVEVRAFHRITVDVQTLKEADRYITLGVHKVYKPTLEIFESPTEMKEVLEDIIQMFVDLRRKYEPYRELAPIFRAIDRVSKKLGI
ncbi:hypothetical protein MUP59_07155, partial [Candidatus Bathyarchaeota archaeon]|nr:hypothetical protein [Candidatus Bathyarchaeota archaeon]